MLLKKTLKSDKQGFAMLKLVCQESVVFSKSVMQVQKKV